MATDVRCDSWRSGLGQGKKHHQSEPARQGHSTPSHARQTAAEPTNRTSTVIKFIDTSIMARGSNDDSKSEYRGCMGSTFKQSAAAAAVVHHDAGYNLIQNIID